MAKYFLGRIVRRERCESVFDRRQRIEGDLVFGPSFKLKSLVT
jgi:hypothetical protein